MVLSMVHGVGRGLVVKRTGVLSKVQMLNLVLGVGVFALLPRSASLNKLKTTPTPNKNGSYGIKGGVRMP